jgi:hypothetical protein
MVSLLLVTILLLAVQATSNGGASLVGDLLSLDDEVSIAPPSAQASASAVDMLQDLLGGDLFMPPPSSTPAAAASPMDLLNFLGDAPVATASAPVVRRVFRFFLVIVTGARQSMYICR